MSQPRKRRRVDLEALAFGPVPTKPFADGVPKPEKKPAAKSKTKRKPKPNTKPPASTEEKAKADPSSSPPAPSATPSLPTPTPAASSKEPSNSTPSSTSAPEPPLQPMTAGQIVDTSFARVREVMKAFAGEEGLTAQTKRSLKSMESMRADLLAQVQTGQPSQVLEVIKAAKKKLGAQRSAVLMGEIRLRLPFLIQ
eukprot:m.53470 g.53470  ORF g.53470 m.53470 type:complete len:196 (+) comp18399_c0_seq4:39-626(+)